MLLLSLSDCLKMVAKKFHNMEAKMQLLRRCSKVSSWTSQSWHLEGPIIPLFLILSYVKIFLCWTTHIKSLIFIQPLCLHSFCQVLSVVLATIIRRIPFTSFMLKLPSLFMPHLSWSCPSVTRIILWSTNLLTVYALLFRVLLSLTCISFHVLHFFVLWECSQKYLTFHNLWLSISCLRPINYSVKCVGSCCHLSSQNNAISPSLISHK